MNLKIHSPQPRSGLCMDKKCQNCKYFRKGSAMPAEYVWGDCMKPGRHSYDINGRKRRGAFTWDDNSCDDFELREILLKKLKDDSS